ncbi:MAG: TatD family hydrolase [Thiogranum sp.]
MELIDTHCHLDVAAFDADRRQVLDRARQQGVRRMVIPAVDAGHWDGLLQFCQSEQALYPALGLHPVYLQAHTRADIEALEPEIEKWRPVAVGEIGLDYFVRELDREKQQDLFEAQLEVARNAGLPVILHVRKAHDQVLSTLRRIRVSGGTAHAFNGSLQQARQYIDMGFKLGFGGMLTYQRSKRIRRLAEELPVDAIVLETDAPDMVVADHRGERNSPEYLPDCLRALAEVRNEDADFLARQTTLNACRVFSLPALPS